MKIRKWLVLVASLSLCLVWAASAAEIRPLLSSRPEKIYAFSVCSLQSPNLATSRVNVMKYLAGFDVDQNRASAPGAAYLIPHSGWQLYDAVTTSFQFWNGILYPPDTALQQERGHRIVLSLTLKGDVRKYWCRVTGTSTNIPAVKFNVATNSSTGQEILFNPQYIGISFGPNGKLESTAKEDGSWEQAGDDRVYQNSERPSLLQYDVVVRFGSSVTYFANQLADLDPLKDEFASGIKMLKFELLTIEGGAETVVDTYTITSAVPSLTIVASNPIVLGITGGQVMGNYYLLSKTHMERIWTLDETVALHTGQTWTDTSESQKFFRLMSLPGPVPNTIVPVQTSTGAKKEFRSSPLVVIDNS